MSAMIPLPLAALSENSIVSALLFSAMGLLLFGAGVVCFLWAIATLGIAGRLWFELTSEVVL